MLWYLIIKNFEVAFTFTSQKRRGHNFFMVDFFLYTLRDGNSKKLSMTRACIPSVFQKIIFILRIRKFTKARKNLLLVVSKIMTRSYSKMFNKTIIQCTRTIGTGSSIENAVIKDWKIRMSSFHFNKCRPFLLSPSWGFPWGRVHTWWLSRR